MQGYSEYKESNIPWLGKVPSHWRLLPCRAIVDNQFEKNEGAEIQEYLSLMANIGVIRYEDKGDVGNKKPDDLAKCKIVKRGNLVINSMNYAIGSYGMSPYDGVCSPVYIVLEPNESLVERRFALRLFENKPMQKHLALLGNGILEHRAAIKWDDIKPQHVPVPPLAEQKAILDFLDRETARIDNLIAEKQTFIKLLKEKRQALINHVVTKGLDPNVKMKDSGIEWIGEVPEGWAICKISYRYEILLGKMLDEKKITGDHLGYYLRNTDVQWDKINNKNLPQMDFRPEEIDRYQVHKGDLLVCEGGEIGRCAVWSFEEPCFYQKALHRLRPYSQKKDYTRFLFYIISDAVNQERFVSRANKSTIAHLPAETFRQYRFAFPNYDEQVKIAEFLDREKKKFDRLLSETEESVRLLLEHRTALISAAVTGKIDVRNHKEEEAA